MAKLRLENDGDTLLGIYVEPWGRDYRLKPSEAVVIVTEDTAHSGQPFSVVTHDQGMSVWAESGHWAEVYDAAGTALECGHQRPDAAD